MRSLRVLTVVGLSTGAIALTAPAASACVLDSFGPQGVSGGSVPPDGPVGYSIRALGTDESPGDSPWVITAGGVEVARGMAVPDSGHEWVGTDTFDMPRLGAYKGDVTVEITFTDSGMRKPFHVLYDGTPAPAEPQTPAPETRKAPPSVPVTQQTPARSARPGSATAGDPATRTPSRANRARPKETGRPAPRVQVKPRSAAPSVRAPRPSHVRTPAPQVRRALEPRPAAAPVARMTQPVTRVARPARHARVHRAAPLGADAILRRVAADRPASMPRSRAVRRVAAPDRTALLFAAGALMLALLAGAAGLTALAVRRRSRLVPEPPDRLAEMEAELQELLAEERLRAEAEAAPAARS